VSCFVVRSPLPWLSGIYDARVSKGYRSKKLFHFARRVTKGKGMPMLPEASLTFNEARMVTILQVGRVRFFGKGTPSTQHWTFDSAHQHLVAEGMIRVMQGDHQLLEPEGLKGHKAVVKEGILYVDDLEVPAASPAGIAEAGEAALLGRDNKLDSYSVDILYGTMKELGRQPTAAHEDVDMAMEDAGAALSAATNVQKVVFTEEQMAQETDDREVRQDIDIAAEDEGDVFALLRAIVQPVQTTVDVKLS
jgi:hypothetical protein